MNFKMLSAVTAAVIGTWSFTVSAGEISMRLNASRAEKKAVSDFCAAYEKVTGQTFKSSPYTLYVGTAGGLADIKCVGR